ncbi:hypothetical protein SRB17_06290 [Streptomyces sp. RB17]|nr:hypothetical protein [Streptomyces sp. RB17]
MPLDGFTPWPEDTALAYRRAGFWQGRPLPELLHDWTREHGPRIALVRGTTRLTYFQLDRRVSRMTAGLRLRGVEPGRRVVVRLPNTPEWATGESHCTRPNRKPSSSPGMPPPATAPLPPGRKPPSFPGVPSPATDLTRSAEAVIGRFGQGSEGKVAGQGGGCWRRAEQICQSLTDERPWVPEGPEGQGPRGAEGAREARGPWGPPAARRQPPAARRQPPAARRRHPRPRPTHQPRSAPTHQPAAAQPTRHAATPDRAPPTSRNPPPPTNRPPLSPPGTPPPPPTPPPPTSRNPPTPPGVQARRWGVPSPAVRTQPGSGPDPGKAATFSGLPARFSPVLE